jgi:hypothetical protein
VLRSGLLPSLFLPCLPCRPLSPLLLTCCRTTPAAPAAPSRNLGLLVAAQLGGASPPIIISLGGLVGQQLSSDRPPPRCRSASTSWAWPCPPAGRLMHRCGRRTAYVLGAVMGVLSGLVAAQGIAIPTS